MNIHADLAGRKCLVLGGGGFLGSHLAMALCAVGADVHACGRKRHFAEPFKDVTWHECELDLGTLKSDWFADILSGADFVFHLAGTSTPAGAEINPAAVLARNANETLALLDLCGEHSVERVIFASSGGTVYGAAGTQAYSEDMPPKPVGMYGIGKLTIEHMMRARNVRNGMSNLVLRIANPFGIYQNGAQGQGAVAIFAKKMLAGEKIEIWGDGSAIRDYVAAPDVARAFLAAASYNGPVDTFNIGSGIGRDLVEVIETIGQILECKPNVDYRPARGFDINRSVLDCGLAKREMGWIPKADWYQSVTETCNWLKTIS